MSSKTNPKKCLIIMATLLFGTSGQASADFTFGTPTNLGPPVNTSRGDFGPSISADGLTLYFSSDRPGGEGYPDLWVTTRATTSEPWEEPVNLGPSVNTSKWSSDPSISADGLEIFFESSRSGGYGKADIWVTIRATIDDDWSTPVNLGPTINSSAYDGGASISGDGLSLYFGSMRPGGYGEGGIWVTTRATTNDDWSAPVNLGPPVNSSTWEESPDISADGLALFFCSERPPGGYLSGDIWVATRLTTNDEWGEPVNLGPTVNSSDVDAAPEISADGSTLFFSSNRPGGLGGFDMWQVSIEPVVDLNGDGIVESADMCIMVDHWGTDEPLCDIGPMPWGDGIVDVRDLIVLAEHLFEEFPPVE